MPLAAQRECLSNRSSMASSVWPQRKAEYRKRASDDDATLVIEMSRVLTEVGSTRLAAVGRCRYRLAARLVNLTAGSTHLGGRFGAEFDDLQPALDDIEASD